MISHLMVVKKTAENILIQSNLSREQKQSHTSIKDLRREKSQIGRALFLPHPKMKHRKRGSLEERALAKKPLVSLKNLKMLHLKI